MRPNKNQAAIDAVNAWYSSELSEKQEAALRDFEQSLSDNPCYICGRKYGEHDSLCSRADHQQELVRRMTAAIREADRDFETGGGSTRHYVHDNLLPILEKHGLVLKLII